MTILSIWYVTFSITILTISSSRSSVPQHRWICSPLSDSCGTPAENCTRWFQWFGHEPEETLLPLSWEIGDLTNHKNVLGGGLKVWIRDAGNVVKEMPELFSVPASVKICCVCFLPKDRLADWNTDFNSKFSLQQMQVYLQQSGRLNSFRLLYVSWKPRQLHFKLKVYSRHNIVI